MLINPVYGDETDDERRRRAFEELMNGGRPPVFAKQRTSQSASEPPPPMEPPDLPPRERRPPRPPVTPPPPDDPNYDSSRYIADVSRRGGPGDTHPWRTGAEKAASTYVSTGGNYYAAGAMGLIAGINAARNKHAETAPTDLAVDDARLVLAQAIKDELGRDPNPGEIDDILRGQGWHPGQRWVGQDNLIKVIDALHQNGQQQQADEGGPTPPGDRTLGGDPGQRPPIPPPPATPPPPTTPPPKTPPKPPPTPPPTFPPRGPTMPTGTDDQGRPLVGKDYGLPPGFDAKRWADPAEKSAKYTYGRDAWVAKQEGKYNAQWVKDWVAAHPQWEIKDADTADPKIRVKQEFMKDFGEEGSTSVWQDVIRDSGGANDLQFINAEGEGDQSQSSNDTSTKPPPGFNFSGAPTDDAFFQELLRRARAITGPTDRDALLNLLNG